jgi:hypothetical protein
MGAALAQLVAGPPPVILRPAREEDVPAIAGLLAAGQLSFLPGPRTAATSASASSPLTKA